MEADFAVWDMGCERLTESPRIMEHQNSMFYRSSFDRQFPHL